MSKSRHKPKVGEIWNFTASNKMCIQYRIIDVGNYTAYMNNGGSYMSAPLAIECILNTKIHISIWNIPDSWSLVETEEQCDIYKLFNEMMMA